jgi:hypothetical protein
MSNKASSRLARNCIVFVLVSGAFINSPAAEECSREATVERNTTGWLHSWNAGVGFEFALQDPTSFFVEARYVRIGPPGGTLDFVPIRMGLHF